MPSVAPPSPPQPLSQNRTVMNPPKSPVAALLSADSIAIIGASNDGNRASGRTLRYLLKYGYAGRIYPVNPNRSVVQGVPAYASVRDLPEAPDVAVIVLPQRPAIDAVRECGRLGVPLAVLFAAGFSEVGGEGVALEKELHDVAQESGIRILGPNSNGAVSVGNKATVTFMTGLDQDRFELRDEGIAFVSQSGAMGGFILNMAQSAGLGMGRFFSLGNEVDLGFPEVLAGLIDEGTTSVVAGYIEGIRDGGALEKALKSAYDRRIPLVFMKVGRSDKGAAAAASHTGALAGADAVYNGIFAKYGVQRAENVQELLDFTRVFAAGKLPSGNRMTIVTLSGGAGALMSDYADEYGVDIFRWNEQWREKIQEVLPSFASTANPIDTTGVIASDLDVLSNSMRVSLDNPETDVLMVLLGNMEAEEDLLCERILAVAAHSDKPVYVSWVGGSGNPERVLAAAGVPTFRDPQQAMKAAAAAMAWTASLGRDVRIDFAPAAQPDVIAAAEESGARFLDEVESKELLSAFGVPVVAERVVDSAQQAGIAASELGFPVVVKILSRELAHKTEVGGVRLNITTADDAAHAAGEMLEAAARLGIGDAKIVVQRGVDAQAEVIVGMSKDPVFGPSVLLGIGGVFAELINDVQIRPVPITHDDARQMIGGLRGLTLLKGFRGRAAADLDALAELVVSFGTAAAALAPHVESIDVNPVLIDAEGRPVAVDALIELPVLRAGGADEQKETRA